MRHYNFFKINSNDSGVEITRSKIDALESLISEKSVNEEKLQVIIHVSRVFQRLYFNFTQSRVKILQQLIQSNEDDNFDLIKKLDTAENCIVSQNRIIENHKIKVAELETYCASLSR